MRGGDHRNVRTDCGARGDGLPGREQHVALRHAGSDDAVQPESRAEARGELTETVFRRISAPRLIREPDKNTSPRWRACFLAMPSRVPSPRPFATSTFHSTSR
jgi:hypothetical protein